MNNRLNTQEKYLTYIFARWLGVSQHELTQEISRVDATKALEYLCAPNVSMTTKVSRKIFHALIGSFSQRAQIEITDILHKLRRPNTQQYEKINEIFFSRARKDLTEALGNRGVVSSEQKGSICITHDVDWQDCYNFVDKLSNLEASYNINSTFNFLTDWNYRIDKRILRDLVRRGSEVGLHGTDHDVALAYRSRNEIRDKLKRGLDRLSIPVKGFRSPALSVSQVLFEVLDELGFQYDSSLYALNPFGRATESFFPYQYPGLKLWEIPLTIQDSLLFRDMRLGEDEAFEMVRNLMDKVIAIKGTFVFCGHPGIIKNHQKFYKMFLDFTSKFKDSARILTLEQTCSLYKTESVI